MKQKRQIIHIHVLLLAVLIILGGTLYWWKHNEAIIESASRQQIWQQESQEIANLKNELEHIKKQNERLIEHTEEYTLREDPITGEYLYNNTRFGFSLKFPKNWNEISEGAPKFSEKTNQLYTGGSAFIEIHPISEKVSNEEIITKLNKGSTPTIMIQSTYLGSNDKYRFFSSVTELHWYQSQNTPNLIYVNKHVIFPSFSTDFKY